MRGKSSWAPEFSKGGFLECSGSQPWLQNYLWSLKKKNADAQTSPLESSVWSDQQPGHQEFKDLPN